ncbi:MAG: ribose-phosphate pyrophosphokinase [Cyanobacteria bacterium NC_groundwater_1444_Ag_S-0.65um_54_12]|nr:ribose-phosphate pyrophosphokinase [Cyanobacteria bacterium NC_groundwater_1444_Ag_S-0.65um_54_12]
MTERSIAEERLAQLKGRIPHRVLKLFSGSANTDLAHEIAELLGIEVGPIRIANFSDGEIYVQIQESVRGADVFLVQPICHQVNYNLMELFIMLDAFKRASARQVTAVIPYFAYARQDRKAQGREAITAKLVADLLTTAGADRIVALDLHAPQIQGFFNILVDHLFATPVLVRWMQRKKVEDEGLVIVSPDVGGVTRARVFAKKLDAPIAIIDKRRPKHNIAEVLHVIGDVRGRVVVIVDDMIDTAGTLAEVSKLLVREGAREVYAAATHAVLSGPAIDRLSSAPIKEIAVTNSIPVPADRRLPNLTILSIADLLAEAIMRIHEDLSVSTLFE